MSEEFFDGPAMGDDDDDWLFSGNAGKDSGYEDSSCSFIEDDRIKLTMKYPSGDADEMMLGEDETFEALMTHGEARFRAIHGQDEYMIFLLKDGEEYYSIYPETTIKSLGVKGRAFDVCVEYSLRAPEPDVTVHPDQKAAEAARNKLSSPSSRIIVKLQGSVELFRGRRGVSTAFVVAKPRASFESIAAGVEENYAVKVRFKFDGDFVRKDETLKSLDIEDFDCLDCVKI